MAFEHVSSGRNGRMARLLFGWYSLLRFQRVQVGRVMGAGEKAMLLEVPDPHFAAAATGALVDIENDRCARGASVRGRSGGCWRRGAIVGSCGFDGARCRWQQREAEQGDASRRLYFFERNAMNGELA